MRYYLMESPEHTSLPLASRDSIITISDKLDYINEIDYDERNSIISDRLKSLIQMYIPSMEFDPVVFASTDGIINAQFWSFIPPKHDDIETIYKGNGLITHIKLIGDKRPLVFSAISPRGNRSVVVQMAIVESAYRRSILGVRFTKLLDYNTL